MTVHFSYVLAKVSHELAVDPEEVTGPDRDGAACDARAIVALCARTLFGYSYPRLGRALNRSQPHAMYLVRRGAELRDTSKRHRQIVFELLGA